MCWDFSAELADFSVGDIFTTKDLPAKIPGVSAVMARSAKGEEVLDGAERAGYIVTSPIPTDSFYNNLGLELKKQIAVYYLQERQSRGWPTPNYHFQPIFNPTEIVSST